MHYKNPTKHVGLVHSKHHYHHTGVDYSTSQMPGVSISYRLTTHFVLRNARQTIAEEFLHYIKIPSDKYITTWYSYNNQSGPLCNQSETYIQSNLCHYRHSFF
jgi:hypothetical protein